MVKFSSKAIVLVQVLFSGITLKGAEVVQIVPLRKQLHTAIGQDFRRVCELLLHVHDLNYAERDEKDKMTTPLYRAAKHGNIDTVRLLIAHRPRPDLLLGCEEDDAIPLHVAAENGHFEVVDYMLTRGVYAI